MTRRGLVAALVVLLGSMPGPVAADGKKVAVGVLKLSSSAPVFLGVERGSFREFGIDSELVYKAGMIPAPLQTRDLVDGSFLEEALRALPR